MEKLVFLKVTNVTTVTTVKNAIKNVCNAPDWYRHEVPEIDTPHAMELAQRSFIKKLENNTYMICIPVSDTEFSFFCSGSGVYTDDEMSIRIANVQELEYTTIEFATSGFTKL